MAEAHRLHRTLVTLGLSLIAAHVAIHAQATQEVYKPQVGQPGKDVVWVPTSQALVDKMLDMAKVTPQDSVIDLGSGDGRTVITAAKRGARALGIEYNPDMVALSKRAAAEAGVSDRATFVKADIFESDFSQATVITMFLLPDLNLKLRPKILDLKPGTRVVSNTFTMDDWQADETATISDGGCTAWCTALLWIVPAKVQGTWRFGQRSQGELTLTQRFQVLIGTLRSGASATPISDGRLRGDQISFVAGGAHYTGSVNGNTITGQTMSSSGNGNWTATRASQ